MTKLGGGVPFVALDVPFVVFADPFVALVDPFVLLVVVHGKHLGWPLHVTR